MKSVRKILVLALGVWLSFVATGCATLSVAGNEGGSVPINHSELVAYKKALMRCYKSGGSRIVKITGQLRCY